jgi:threonine dehydrogenase-like Zn-dependent dehydrogenase
MRYVELVDLRKFEQKEGPIPEVGPDEIRIKVQRVGVCGSDMHAFQGTHPFVHPPMVFIVLPKIHPNVTNPSR